MFRKLWKTLRFFLVIAVILICLPHSILPKQTSEIKKSDLEEYSRLNRNERRLEEYSDDDEALKLKLRQLELINLSRRRNNAPEVKLDIFASRVANKMAREAAVNNFTGHWNLAGEKPYHRYGLAGGYDHIMENAYGQWTSGSYEQTSEEISSMMKKGHDIFMDEKAPYDGHRKNIINKTHNYIGIGYAITSNQFRYYEEFIDRNFEFEKVPGRVGTGESFDLRVKVPAGSFLYYAVVYRDDFPKAMTPAEINRIGSYKDFGDEEYSALAAWDLAKYRKGSEYTIPLTFTKAGLYYIQLYEDKKEITGGGSVSTSGKTPFSGIVIRAAN